MPECKMASYVMFYVVRGTAEVTVEKEKHHIKEGQVLITEPATLSMTTADGVRIMGVQITKNNRSKL